jgi:hypothetical protein
MSPLPVDTVVSGMLRLKQMLEVMHCVDMAAYTDGTGSMISGILNWFADSNAHKPSKAEERRDCLIVATSLGAPPCVSIWNKSYAELAPAYSTGFSVAG